MTQSRSSTAENERVLRLAADSPADLARLLAGPDEALLAAQPSPGTATSCRLGIVAPNAKRLALARKLVAGGRGWRGRNDIWFSPAPLLAGGGATAFVFPGLEADFAPSIVDVASWLGKPAPATSTETIGRHAEGVVGVGQLLTEALHRLGIRPDALAGHSVGEWSAMIAGGMFTESEIGDLVARTDLDSMLVPGVDFGVLGCGVDRVQEDLRGRTDLVVSHENSTNQTVVCGPVQAVAELIDSYRARGVICQTLPFRSGFHTPLLQPHLSGFAAEVAALPLRAARIPVWSATTTAPFPSDQDEIRRIYLRHLVEPVRFRGLVLVMHDAGVRVFVQVGSGQLGSLIDDTLRDVDHLTVAANSAHRPGIAQLRRLATAMWVEGGQPDFAALDLTPISMPMRNGEADVDPLARLEELGERFPPAAELGVLMREVADAVSTVLTASTRQASAAMDTTLHVSTRDMPYLLDHCIAKQRPGWPDTTDRRPVVPATTMIRHMMAAAERAAPGQIAVGVDEVELHRWLVAAPPRDVPVEVRPLDSQRVRVTLGDHAEAVVLLADGYQAASSDPWPLPTGERRPRLSAADLYQQGWLFHGPRFQAVTATTAISQFGVRGDITIPDAPGALLDGVGQVLGLWLTENRAAGCVAFPMRIGRVRFHAPEPIAGSTVNCSVRIGNVTEDTIEADAQVTVAGRVLVSITGWQDRQFDDDPVIGAVHRRPESSTLAQRQPGGWWAGTERWRSLASRELFVHKYFAASERAQYESLRPTERRQWLLRRIVIKDAVRGWLWDHGAGPLFPAEIAVEEDAAGRIFATGRYGLDVPALDIAVAHCREMAVAQVRRLTPNGVPSTIRITEDIPSTLQAAAIAAAAQDDRIGCEQLNNPEGMPPRTYLVTWSLEPAQHTQKEQMR